MKLMTGMLKWESWIQPKRQCLPIRRQRRQQVTLRNLGHHQRACHTNNMAHHKAGIWEIPAGKNHLIRIATLLLLHRSNTIRQTILKHTTARPLSMGTLLTRLLRARDTSPQSYTEDRSQAQPTTHSRRIVPNRPMSCRRDGSQPRAHFGMYELLLCR